MGVRAGISDLFLPYPLNGKHGCWIELKRNDPKCKPTYNQNQWLERMKGVNYATYICHGWLEGAAVLTQYLKGDF